MYVWLRMARIIAASRWAARRGPALDPLDEVRTPLRIGLHDVDMLMHLNNGRYLTLLDLGRIQLAERTGMVNVMRARRWHPVVASATVRFRRSLELFDRVELVTRLVYWDDKWFYLEQRIDKGGKAHARALIKGALRSGEGRSVPLAELIAALGETERPVPPMPEAVRRWRNFEEEFK